jgi:hypothetical protein
MMNFADQLYDDLMREHGPMLAEIRPPASRRPVTARRTLLAAGAGGVAVAATVAGLVAGSGSPAYALTTNPDGTVTLAVHQAAGIGQANAKLRALGDNVVVVPIRAGCPALRPPAASARGELVTTQAGRSADGGITVSGHAPAGDIIVVGVMTGTAHETAMVSQVSSPPAPSCISPPAAP